VGCFIGLWRLFFCWLSWRSFNSLGLNFLNLIDQDDDEPIPEPEQTMLEGSSDSSHWKLYLLKRRLLVEKKREKKQEMPKDFFTVIQVKKKKCNDKVVFDYLNCHDMNCYSPPAPELKSVFPKFFFLRQWFLNVELLIKGPNMLIFVFTTPSKVYTWD